MAISFFLGSIFYYYPLKTCIYLLFSYLTAKYCVYVEKFYSITKYELKYAITGANGHNMQVQFIPKPPEEWYRSHTS